MKLLLFLVSAINGQAPEFIGDILGRTHISEADALQTYTSLSVEEITDFLDVSYSLDSFDVEHGFDGFFVDLLKSFPMRMMLQPKSATENLQQFHGVGFDLDGEHFDVLAGRINQDGEWAFIKQYNGQGPQGWTHNWRYSGQMQGAIWSGGLNFAGSNPDKKALAQSFFYPNGTDPHPAKKPSGQSGVQSDAKPIPHCIQKLYTLRTNYLIGIDDIKSKRRFSKRIGHLILMLENVSRSRNKSGDVSNLTDLPEDFKHRIRFRLSDINKICFKNMIMERYSSKKNLGKHLTTRAKKIFKHICALTDEKDDEKFCRRK